MSKVPLKHCPFCGGEGEIQMLNDSENFGGNVIACKSCLCSTKVFFGEKEGLLDSWNKRSPQVKQKKGGNNDQ